jgi:predicted ATPase
MIHLREIAITPSFSKKEGYPYSVRFLEEFDRLEFTKPITLFVGENGSGKSTLLEGMAQAIGAVTIGSLDIARDPTLTAVKPLADALRLVWKKRTHKGFFLRVEFFLVISGSSELLNNLSQKTSLPSIRILKAAQIMQRH